MGLFEDIIAIATPAVQNAASDAVKDALDKNKTPLPATVVTPPAATSAGMFSSLDSTSMILLLGAVGVIGAALLFKKKGK